MPGWELINHKEKKSLLSLFNEGGCLFAHGFEKHRKRFHVREFEKNIKNRFKSKYCVAVSSGTAAIKIALKALGVKRNDEVITQCFNFVATVEAIIDIGAKPIICNIDSSLNMCPKDLKKKITKKTKAIIPVHMLGVSCDMQKIKKIAKNKSIKILEDNCESVGGKYGKKFLGNVSNIGVLSFDFSKTITTGEGGAILTNNKKLYKFCKEYHDHGHQNNKKFSRGRDTVEYAGFNYRMTEMQAIIGKEQLKKLTFILKENKKRHRLINDILKNKFTIREINKNSTSIYDTFIFKVGSISKKKSIIKFLKKNLGTKNLPDAIKWHCSYYWKHMLSKKEIRNSFKGKQLLEQHIAIPILLKKSLSSYKFVANKINNI